MFETNVTKIGEASIITVTGHMDSISSRQLEQVLKNLMDDNTLNIILDMDGINYISAAGLRVLRQLHEKQGIVHIVKPSPRVREVLQITGLDIVYKMHKSITEVMHNIQVVTNAHTHLELGWLAQECPSVVGQEFFKWITEVIIKRWGETENKDQLFEKSIEQGIQKLIDAGTTVVGDITRSGKSIKPLLESGLNGVAYVELIGNNPKNVTETFEQVKKTIETWRSKDTSKMKVGISLHTPYSVHPALWKKGVEYAQKENLPVCIHVAESPAEQEFMQKGTGLIKDIYYKNATPILHPGKSSIDYLEQTGALALKPLLVHVIHVSDEDIQKIKTSGSTVVHCPRSNLRLQCGRMPLEKFIEQEIPVLLGTDSLASSPSLNIFDELEVATALHYGDVPARKLKELIHKTMPMDSSSES